VAHLERHRHGASRRPPVFAEFQAQERGQREERMRCWRRPCSYQASHRSSVLIYGVEALDFVATHADQQIGHHLFQPASTTANGSGPPISSCDLRRRSRPKRKERSWRHIARHGITLAETTSQDPYVMGTSPSVPWKLR
jgi:hypothetical protein